MVDIHSGDSRSVLLAEDDDSVATLVEFKLKRAGFGVERVARGDLALERLASAARAGEPFGFAVLDGRLPGKDGVTVMEDAAAFGWVAGGVLASADELASVTPPPGWIKLRKPFDLNVLLEFVRTGIESHAREAPVAEEDPVVESLRAEFRTSFAGKASELRRILDTVAGKDRDAELLRFAHNLAGSAGTYGFHAVSELAARVEESVPGGDFGAPAQQLLERLSSGG